MKISRKDLWGLFKIFFKAGTFTFAGGLAMLPVIEKDVVENYQFCDRETFMEYATLSQSLPGVIALNCAAFVGRHAGGTLGMLVAALGSTISAFILMLAATVAIGFLPEAGPVVSAMECIRAASAALVLAAAFSLGRHNIKSFFSIVVMLAAFTAIAVFSISTPLVVLSAGAVGYLYQQFYLRKRGESS